MRKPPTPFLLVATDCCYVGDALLTCILLAAPGCSDNGCTGDSIFMVGVVHEGSNQDQDWLMGPGEKNNFMNDRISSFKCWDPNP